MSCELTAVNLLKCTNCNLVVNELLTFVQNKNDIMDSESLVRICASAFNTEDIDKAKCLLFQSISSEMRNIKRKNKSKQGKANKDLFDIIDVFKQIDPEKVPVFVASDLNKLPPVTFDHVDVSRLLKDIILLKQEVHDIKSTYSTADQVRQLEEQIKNIGQNNISNDTIIDTPFDRNVNLRRGAFFSSINSDSGPMGLSPLTSRLSYRPIATDCNGETKMTSEVNDRSDKCADDDPCCESLSRSNTQGGNYAAISHPQKHVEATAVSQTSVQTALAHTDRAVRPTMVPLASSESASRFAREADSAVLPLSKEIRPRASFAEIAGAEGEWKKPDKDSEWITVRRNKSKDRFIGNKGTAKSNSESKFKAADIRLPLFINNVDKDTAAADIVEYIMEKTKVSVTLEKIEMKRQKEYNAYKIFVPRHKLVLFMDDSIWPEGISFRRYITFRSKPKTGHAIAEQNISN